MARDAQAETTMGDLCASRGGANTSSRAAGGVESQFLEAELIVIRTPRAYIRPCFQCPGDDQTRVHLRPTSPGHKHLYRCRNFPLPYTASPSDLRYLLIRLFFTSHDHTSLSNTTWGFRCRTTSLPNPVGTPLPHYCERLLDGCDHFASQRAFGMVLLTQICFSGWPILFEAVRRGED